MNLLPGYACECFVRCFWRQIHQSNHLAELRCVSFVYGVPYYRQLTTHLSRSPEQKFQNNFTRFLSIGVARVSEYGGISTFRSKESTSKTNGLKTVHTPPRQIFSTVLSKSRDWSQTE